MRACCDDAAQDASLAALIELGLNHEQQHQELILTDILHLLSCNRRGPCPTRRARCARSARRARMDCMPGGHRAHRSRGRGIAFDNEGPHHRVWLEAFELASRPVTNGEYCAFIDDGGYRRPELWLSLGWDAVVARGWEAPLYWERDSESLAFVHAPWNVRARSGSAGRAHQPVRSGCIRALGSRPIADRVRMGSDRAARE